MAGGAVAITGPRGFCVDTQASRSDEMRAFVLLGSCTALSPGAVGIAPDEPAILTASVLSGGFAGGEPIGAVLPEMAKFFQSDKGRAALSRKGSASTVEVVEIRQDAQTLYLRIRDTAPMGGAKVETEYVRAVLTIRGRIVTLSVLGLTDRPLSLGDKRSLLTAFVERVRRANSSL